MKGLAVSFSRLLEEQTEKSRALVLKMFEKGGFFAYRIDECKIYVCTDGESGPRLTRAQENGAKIMTDEEFSRYLENLGD